VSRNLDLARQLYEVWNREGVGMFESLRDRIAPEVESVEPPEFPGAGAHTGVEEWRAAMERQLEGWDRIVFEPQEFFESGDRVMVEARVVTRGRSTQLETEFTIFHVITVLNGRVTRFMSFFRRDLAHAELARNVSS